VSRTTTPPREWTQTSRAQLRAYLQQTREELIEQLTVIGPVRATEEELLRDPADTITRRELLRQGYEKAIENIVALSEPDIVHSDHGT